MRQFAITLCLCLCGVTASSQYFEGKVVYHNVYKSRTPGTSDGQFNSMLGNVQSYFIKNGNYKYESNGGFLLWQLYIAKHKKLYSKIAHSQTILWDDVSINPTKITSTEYHKGVTTILGYLCDELILHYDSNYQKYYFNSKLAIDSKSYADHLFNSWYAYVSKANAVPLKMSVRCEKYFMESVATEVKPMKLADGFFTLPPNVKIEKSPF